MQNLRHHPHKDRHHHDEPRHQRPTDILPPRPLHLPRSPPRRHQRLPPRPQAHLQQTRRLRRLRLALVRHVGHDPHLHAPEPDGLEMDDPRGDDDEEEEAGLGNGEGDAGDASVARGPWGAGDDVPAAPVRGRQGGGHDVRVTRGREESVVGFAGPAERTAGAAEGGRLPGESREGLGEKERWPGRPGAEGVGCGEGHRRGE